LQPLEIKTLRNTEQQLVHDEKITQLQRSFLKASKMERELETGRDIYYSAQQRKLLVQFVSEAAKSCGLDHNTAQTALKLMDIYTQTLATDPF